MRKRLRERERERQLSSNIFLHVQVNFLCSYRSTMRMRVVSCATISDVRKKLNEGAKKQKQKKTLLIISLLIQYLFILQTMIPISQ